MIKMTSEEMFDKGLQALNSPNYEAAEQLFLNILYNSLDDEDSPLLYKLGAIEQLALFIYPIKTLPGSERSLQFYKHLSPVDRMASLGFAYAIINGVIDNKNYFEAIRQLSKVDYPHNLYPIGYLLYNGFGLEKDDTKAKSLLLSSYLKGNKQAMELAKSLGIIEGWQEELDEEQEGELYQVNSKIINEVYSKEDRNLNIDDTKNRNQAIKEFFNDIHFTPL